ncbi:MAG: hypothetical protein PHE86_06670 [Candidatus Marinimicrobia bacterium]|nr:hypothetical protein [Candidatus Neomarinimicrobiota bacterium]MDD5581705.1 hypothetical protein [Candidatus Neomarinimicrobiota bacterium]
MVLSVYRNALKNLQTVHWSVFWGLWSLLSMITLWFYQDHFTTRETVEQFLGDQFSPVYIDLIFARIQDMTYISILLIPLLILCRTLFMALILHLFFLLWQLEIPFKKVFYVIMTVFGMMVLKDISKIFPLFLENSSSNITNNILIVPLSLSSAFSFSFHPMLNRLLNAINIFEGMWMILVAFIITIWTGIKVKKIIGPLILARWLSIVLLWGLGIFYEIFMV